MTCSPVPRGSDIVPEPVVVFEVLSRTAARIDRTVKNAEYRNSPSIRSYVMLEQDAAAATVYSRAGESWVSALAIGADALLDLPALGISIPMAEVYADVELGDETPDD